ncbi:hypothetical protein BGW38_001211 [Lunasporangiospora selenospora]|uniref:Endonuclease/exonuclease/phosphatase domain-containing protein n=1 Tax=Lunasporangiospora selenospora TaxID=979761 RepID=A0A9P6FUD8_9FUNG|nr:hypothetical protein BGW38_001211 [Lunasporangiospora selenospora]
MPNATARSVPLPQPGELLIYDCRQTKADSTTVLSGSTNSWDRPPAAASPPTPTPSSPQNSATVGGEGLRQRTRGRGGETTEEGQASYAHNLEGKEENGEGEGGRVQSLPNASKLPRSEWAGQDEQNYPTAGVTEQGAWSSNKSNHARTTAKISEQTPADAPAETTGQQSQQQQHQPIRCLQWNIERNYKSAEILEMLSRIDADILCIQEIDIGCHRSGYDRDHFLEICQSQGLYGGFVPEFWELEHPGRKDRDQGGGVHGNAIFSKWPINGFRVLDHVHHAYEWERDGHKLNEPRLGRRFTIVADIQTPSGPLLCYCAHLEVFTGIIGRISAISDILADSELYSERYPYQILFGDLNTISHSIARLAKTISTDQYRIGSLGSDEAEWWDRNLWSWHVMDGDFNLGLATGGWTWLRQLGFLGLRTGNTSTTTFKETRAWPKWSADSKYSSWLKNLVGGGLEKVKQARQEQFFNDTFIATNHRFIHFTKQSQESRILESMPTSGSVWTKSDAEATSRTSLESKETGSEKDYHDDGSVILVSRPRSPSIITLDSSAIEKSECTSPWSTLSSPGDHRFSINGESDDESDLDKRRLNLGAGSWATGPHPSTTAPSTPSPTLRLIPPTPKQRHSRLLDTALENDELIELDLELKRRMEEDRRIITLHIDEEEYEGEIQDLQQRQYDSLHRYQQDSSTKSLYDNESNLTNDTTVTTSTLMKHETISVQRWEQQQQQGEEISYQSQESYQEDTLRQQQRQSSTSNDKDFQEPQPPFLLSAFRETPLTSRQLWSGFTPLVLHQARNPGFYDPWSAGLDLTLHNPSYFGLLRAKLDYTLLMNLKCVRREMGNHDYGASDHKWLVVEVEFERDFLTKAKPQDSREGQNEYESEALNKEATGEKTTQEMSGKCHTESQSPHTLPSKAQRYLWWRERRQELDQHVQPIELQGMRGKDNTRGSGILGSAVAIVASTVALGGLWWWTKRS